MNLLTPEVASFIGMVGERREACDLVERGSVRRYAQAIEDIDSSYMEDTGGRFGGPVAPLLYPSFMFRQSFFGTDVLTQRAGDENFDGLVTAIGNGLPELPLKNMALLNGGAEIELFRYANHGERIFQRSQYADIFEKQTRTGAVLMVVIETTFEDEWARPLLKARKTLIRRPSEKAN
jgi:hypothetical protein